MPWLEDANNVKTYNVDMSVVKQPRAFKSHMPYNFMPCGLPNGKYMYVVRNPKVVVISYFNFHISLKFAVSIGPLLLPKKGSC